MKTSRLLLVPLLSAALAASSNAQPAEPLPGTIYGTLTTSDLLDFRYSIPSIVGTYPPLLAKILAKRKAAYDDALRIAREDAAERHQNPSYPFHRNELWTDWTVTGESYPLLSLQAHTDNFTGGAHGNHFTTALLWDEKRNTELVVDRLFGGAAALWRRIGPLYCRKLDAERRRRKMDPVGCPERKELTIVPVDSDFDYEFDSLRVIADPYVAGSYAEGTYVVSVPITPALLKTISSAYRKAFEAQRQ